MFGDIDIGDTVKVFDKPGYTPSRGMIGEVIGINKLFGHISVRVVFQTKRRRYTETMPISWLTKVEKIDLTPAR